MINVNKRGGGIEEFSLDKLINSLAKAGVSVKDAEAVAKKIQAWANTNKKNNTINSSSLRDQVIINLKKDFPIEEENYELYSKI